MNQLLEGLNLVITPNTRRSGGHKPPTMISPRRSAYGEHVKRASVFEEKSSSVDLPEQSWTVWLDPISNLQTSAISTTHDMLHISGHVQVPYAPRHTLWLYKDRDLHTPRNATTRQVTCSKEQKIIILPT